MSHDYATPVPIELYTSRYKLLNVAYGVGRVVSRREYLKRVIRLPSNKRLLMTIEIKMNRVLIRHGYARHVMMFAMTQGDHARILLASDWASTLEFLHILRE